MPSTIFRRLLDRDFRFSRNDLRKIAYWCYNKYKAKYGADPDRIDQQEGDQVFNVFIYPDEWLPELDNIIDWYYDKKAIRAQNHKELEAQILIEKEKKLAELIKKAKEKKERKEKTKQSDKFKKVAGKGKRTDSKNKKPERTSKFNKAGKTDKSGKFGKTNKFDKTKRFDSTNRFDKTKRFDSTNRFDKTNRYDSNYRTDSGNRYESNTRFDPSKRFERNPRPDNQIPAQQYESKKIVVEYEETTADGQKRKRRRIHQAVFIADEKK